MKKVLHYIPKYAYLPLLMVVLMNFLTYNGSKIITNHLYHYNTYSFIDEIIPFVPIFISIYILSYIQWIIGFINISKENKQTCYKFLSAELIAKTICLFFFIVFPTTLIRPEIVGNSLWENLTKFIYRADAPVNLFPSIHCLESWICFRGSMSLKSVSKPYKIFMFIFSGLVCASTVLVKQHVFIDIIGGILVVEIGIFLSNKFNTGIIFEKVNERLKKIN